MLEMVEIPGNGTIDPFWMQDTPFTEIDSCEGVPWMGTIGDVRKFCDLQSIREGLKPYYRSGRIGNGYRLPTKEQWLHACSGKSDHALGFPIEKISEYAVLECTEGSCVATKNSNSLGLYDMVGNVQEWAETTTGLYIMGGSYKTRVNNILTELSIPRAHYNNDIAGFRLVLPDRNQPQTQPSENIMTVISTVSDSMITSATTGAKQAVAASLNEEVVNLLMKMFELPDQPGVRTVLGFVAPTVLVAMSKACPGVMLGQEQKVASMAEAANTVNFQQLIAPNLDAIKALLMRIPE